MADLILVEGNGAPGLDRRVVSLAAAVGIVACPATAAEVVESAGQARHHADADGSCLALSAETLAYLDAVRGADVVLSTALAWRCAGLLIYGCSDSPRQAAALTRLTDGAVVHLSGVSDPSPQIAFPVEGKAMSRQLAEVPMAGTHGQSMCTFGLRDGMPGVTVAVTANARPVLVRVQQRSVDVFLHSGPVADVTQPVDRRYRLSEDYDALIPLLIFLRGFFGEACWHASHSSARLTIDDPLLEKAYGFIDFQSLHRSMQRAGYGATIGFIPWNHWRTSRRGAARLSAGPHHVSLCIHGCDHVNKEFASSDGALLERRATLAVQRMEALSRRAGAPFDRVMVFPQGLFSKAAPAALRASGYLAAVNSSCVPVDSDPSLHLRDLLRPAVTRYGGFPVFGRRDPGPVVDFAVDLFLGKPALLVVHHEDFRAGYGRLESLVAQLHKVEPQLGWPPLGSLLSASSLQRQTRDGRMEVEFFTAAYRMAAAQGRPAQIVLRRYEPTPHLVVGVLVDGTSAPFSFEGEYLLLELDLDPNAPHVIQVLDAPRVGTRPAGFGLKHNAGVAARRALSEFRDNVLSRHDAAARFARTVARAMRLTGDS